MGYSASWDGHIKFKKDITNNIIEECEYVFTELHHDPVNKTLEFYGNGKYHDDEVYSFLNRITNITESGEIKFHGEDDTHWRFIFKDNEWKEESGKVCYESDFGDKDEFIGRIIDVIQDCIDNPRGYIIKDEWYDEVAGELEDIMKAWDIF